MMPQRDEAATIHESLDLAAGSVAPQRGEGPGKTPAGSADTELCAGVAPIVHWEDPPLDCPVVVFFGFREPHQAGSQQRLAPQINRWRGALWKIRNAQPRRS